MDHTTFVHHTERTHDLTHNVHDLARIEHAAFDALGQALALEQLHHEIGPAVAKIAEVEDVDDVGMAYTCRRARLAHKALRRGRVLVERLAAQHLERVVAAEHDVLDAKHRTHAALAER